MASVMGIFFCLDQDQSVFNTSVYREFLSSIGGTLLDGGGKQLSRQYLPSYQKLVNWIGQGRNRFLNCPDRHSAGTEAIFGLRVSLKAIRPCSWVRISWGCRRLYRQQESGGTPRGAGCSLPSKGTFSYSPGPAICCCWIRGEFNPRR